VGSNQESLILTPGVPHPGAPTISSWNLDGEINPGFHFLFCGKISILASWKKK